MPSKIIGEGATQKIMLQDKGEIKNCRSKKSSNKQLGYVPCPIIGVTDFENNMGSFKRMFILSLDQTLAYMEQLDMTYAKCLKKLHKMEEHLTISTKFTQKRSNIHEKHTKSKKSSSDPKEKYLGARHYSNPAMSTISMEKPVSKHKTTKKLIPIPDEKLNGRISLAKNIYSHLQLEHKVVDENGGRNAKFIRGARSSTMSRERVADQPGPTPLVGVRNVAKNINSSRMVTKRQARIELSTDSSSSTLSPKPTLERNKQKPLRMEESKGVEGRPVQIHKHLNRVLITNKTENKLSALQFRRNKPAPSAKEIEKSHVKKMNSVKSQIPVPDHKSAILNSTQAESQKTLQIPSGGLETLDKRPSLASITKMPNFGGSGFTDSLDLDKLGGELFQADDLPEISNEVLLRDYGNYFTKSPITRQRSTQNPAGTFGSITLSDEENFSLPGSDQESIIDEAKVNGRNELDTDIDVPPIPYETKSQSNATINGIIIEVDLSEKSSKKSSESSINNATIIKSISPSNSSTKLINGKSQRTSSSENPEIFISSDDSKKSSKARSQKLSSSQSSNSTAKEHKSNSNSDSGDIISKSNPSSNNEETDKIQNTVKEDIKSISSSNSSSKGRQKRLLVKKDSLQNIVKELSQSSSSNDSNKSSGNQKKPNLLNNGEFKTDSIDFAMKNLEKAEQLSKDSYISTSNSSNNSEKFSQEQKLPVSGNFALKSREKDENLHMNSELSTDSSNNTRKFPQKQNPKLLHNGDSKSVSDEVAFQNSEKDEKLSIDSSSSNDSDKFSQKYNGKLKELINGVREPYDRESFDSYHSSDGLSSIENNASHNNDSSKQNGDRHGGEESADSSGSDDSSSTKSYDISPQASNDTQSNEVSSQEPRDINHVSILPSVMEEDETSGNFTDLYASDGSKPVEGNISKIDVGHLNISLKPSLYENDLKQPTLQPDSPDSETSTISLESS